ncbi:MAG TPA: PQQ-dependent sugar dehydrogenase [Thermoleophilaceae bacterium]
MPRRTVLLGLLVAAFLPTSAHAGVVATHVGDFDNPTYITSPPGDTHRVMVVEQPGVVKVIKDGVIQSTPFLDISSIVTGPTHYPIDPEQGLLSIAFPPDYATSKRFYAYYTSKTCTDSLGCDDVLAEFDATSADQASPTPHVLIDMPHPNHVNHNGGQLQFGPDGDLYISTGDGGGSNDVEHNAQQKSNLLGKILRIHPGASSYSIPAGNPFSGDNCHTGSNGGSNCPEIWSYGLRNPWRFSFDSVTGDMIIGDVGQSRDEEIDFAPHPGLNAGVNYGWPCYEGFELNAARPSAECTPLPSPVTFPQLVYHHSCAGASFCGEGVIGGYVMHDPSLPALGGCYVYGDLGTPRLRTVRLTATSATGDTDLGPQVSSLSSFGEDASGHLWAADVTGPVYRLDFDGNAATTQTCYGSPGGPTPPPAATDKTPPTLSLRWHRHQRVLRTRSIKVAVKVNEASTLTGTGTIRTGGKAAVIRFKRARRKVVPGHRVTLKLRLTKRGFRSLRRAMSHRRTRIAHVTVTAKDAAGNGRSRRISIRLVH